MFVILLLPTPMIAQARTPEFRPLARMINFMAFFVLSPLLEFLFPLFIVSDKKFLHLDFCLGIPVEVY